MGGGMNRTLQLVGIHGLTSLRLTASRRYWLPRLTLAFIAAADLLTVMRDGDLHSWGPPASSLVLGVSCFSLCREDITGRTLPLPLPRHLLAVVSILAQFLVCIALVMALILTGAAFDVLVFEQTPEHLLSGAEVRLMLGIAAAAFPFAAAIVFGWSHLRHPRYAWTNRAWHQVIPPLIAATAGFVGLQMAAEQLGAHTVMTRYLLIWAVSSGLLSSAAVFYFGVTAVFPERTDLVRPARPAPLQLRRTVWRSQAIKWSVFLSGLALFLGTIDVVGTRARPILICYAALLPFFSMIGVSGGESIVGSRRVMGLWSWNHSGWRLVPVRRQHIQRLLLLDIIGFAVAATVLLHVAAWLVGGHAPINPNRTSWVYELHRFAWIFTWFTGCTLPAMVLFLIPRRRFGTGTAAVAIVATLWAMKSALGGVFNLGLPYDDHAIILASWVLLTGVLLGQFSSPSSRLFDTGAPVGQAYQRAGIILRSRATPWSLAAVFAASAAIGITVHRSVIRDAAERQAVDQMTSDQVDRLIRDLQRIAEVNVLDIPTRTRDAGALLNPYIGLDDGTPAVEDVWWSDVKHSRMLNRRTHWSTAPDDIEIGDLSILKELMAYDHWEAGRLPSDDGTAHDGRGAYDAYLREVPHNAYLSILQPAPNPLALVDLAKFRLQQGLRTGDMLPALQEVRHLARLLHSDETLVHTVMAIALLRFERRAVEAATERGLLASTDWTVPTEDDLNAMHRVVVTKTYMLAGGADAAQWERITALGPDTFGLCAAIHDAVSIEMAYPTITPWPGEVFPTRVMPLTEPTLAASGCSLPLARNTLARSRSASMSMIPEDALYRIDRLNFIKQLLSSEFSESTLMMLHVPYLRGHAWAEVVADIKLTGFSMYGERPEDDWNGARVLHQRGPGASAE